MHKFPATYQPDVNSTRCYSASVIRYLLVMFMTVSAFYLQPCHAADRQNLFDWYYSAVFGTGAYSIAGRDVFLISGPYERTVREATPDNREIVFTLPVTLGFYDYNVDSITDLEIPTDVAMATIFPGFYTIVPMSRRWTLKPFVNFGYGKEFAGGEEAFIYAGGVRSMFRMREDQWRLAFGNALYYAGNTRQGETDMGFAAFETAVDVSHATGYAIQGQQLYLGPYAALYLFSNLEFIESDQTTFELDHQYEVGLSMSTQKPITILGAEFDRIGIGYLTASNFKAWRLVFSLPY